MTATRCEVWLEAGDKDRLLTALNMRCCVIETGDPALRAADAERCFDPRDPGAPRVRPLSVDQMREIIAHEELADRVAAVRPVQAPPPAASAVFPKF